MRQWYKSAPMKGILLLMEHVFAVVAVICLIFVLAYPGQEYGKNIGDLSKNDYADTKGFANTVQSAFHTIQSQIELQEQFETEGKYDPNKIVDIVEYREEGTISGQNTSGVAYRLDDLIQWAQSYGQEESTAANIIVCKKPDGTFDYFTLDEFRKQLDSGLKFSDEEEAESNWRDLKNNYVSEGYSDNEIAVENEAGEAVYTDCWNLSNSVIVNETVKTVDGKTLMEIANENEAWNGKLSQLYKILNNTLNNILGELNAYEEYETTWTEGNTNLTYLFADLDSGRIYSNSQAYTDINQMSEYVQELKEKGRYVYATPKLADFDTNFNTEAASWSQRSILGTEQYEYILAVDTEYPIQDTFYAENKLFDKYAPIINTVLIWGIISIAGFVIGLVWLTIISGRNVKNEEVQLVWFDRLKTEIGIALIIGLWSLAVAFIAAVLETWFMASSSSDVVYDYGYRSVTRAMSEGAVAENVVLAAFAAFVCCAAFFVGYLSMIRRIKAKTLWKNSVTLWMIGAMRELFSHFSCTWRTLVCVLGFIIVHWIAIGTMGQGGWMFVTFVVEGYVVYYMIRKAIAKEKLKNGIAHIANGEVDYQIPLKGLKGDELDMAAHINHIGEGLSKAVEKSMKDERLKTDLITNVSHDIKTPLTSIINYVDLLKRENIQDPKIQGYLDILEAKAQRLKHLTEDVVEASKISSGNITMEYMNINFVEMINQTTGEFAEKFEKRNLQIVLNVPDHPVLIRSDGRRMWRVVENIYNNAAKYAMEGTRVYADMIEKEHTVEFSLKNISEQPLNISADELTERFIRGDVSRSTEGSGLGLSIAKNLTQLQGGAFNLYLDGDLFKVTIVFPKVPYKK